MEKRLILAIVLSFLVLFGFQALFNKPNKAPQNAVAPAVVAPSTPVPGTAGAIQEKPKAAATETKPAPAEPLPPEPRGGGREGRDGGRRRNVALPGRLVEQGRRPQELEAQEASKQPQARKTSSSSRLWPRRSGAIPSPWGSTTRPWPGSSTPRSSRPPGPGSTSPTGRRARSASSFRTGLRSGPRRPSASPAAATP